MVSLFVRLRRWAGTWRQESRFEFATVATAACATLLTAATIATGLTGPLDRRLSDRWFSASSREPSEHIVIVDISSAAQQAGDMLHLPRTRLAELLRRFGAVGVGKTLIDLNLSGATTPAADRELEAALAGLSPSRVAITTTAVVASDASGTPRWRRTGVFEPFTHNATLVSSDLAFDPDGQLRSFGVESADLPPLLSGADWLNGRMVPGKPRRIDYGIDVTHVPVLDAAALLDDQGSMAKLAGRDVVLANYAAALGNEIGVPRFGALRRSGITALSAETLLQHRQLWPIPRPLGILAMIVLAAGVALWTLRLGPLLGASAALGIALCIFGGAAFLQNRFGVIVPAASALLATILGHAMAQTAVLPWLSGLRRAVRALVSGTANQELVRAMDESGEALVMFEPNGTVVSMNAAARGLFPCSDGAAMSVADLIGAQADELLSATRASRPGRLVAVIEGEKRRHLDLTVSTMRQGARTWIGVASIRDVTDQQKQLDELRLLLVQDTLTGLANRLGFDQALAEHCAVAHQPGGNELAVLLCDLDGFKGVNDTKGHQAGDAVLVEIGRRLRAATKPGTLIARLGGDEFGLIVRANRADREDMTLLLNEIRAQIAAPIAIGNGTASVGISIGTALYPSHGCIPDDLMRIADAEMYRDKRDRAEKAPDCNRAA